ncbi:unnamed protein product [Lactuca saligna]|uniref:Uncharacterized protein n=1 Tax=Lactuca saligna TaxID=75948 RepID=A0AA35YT84_LACSI|nr:unnamed protein product [Lactuca saligna]
MRVLLAKDPPPPPHGGGCYRSATHFCLLSSFCRHQPPWEVVVCLCILCVRSLCTLWARTTTTTIGNGGCRLPATIRKLGHSWTIRGLFVNPFGIGPRWAHWAWFNYGPDWWTIFRPNNGKDPPIRTTGDSRSLRPLFQFASGRSTGTLHTGGINFQVFPFYDQSSKMSGHYDGWNEILKIQKFRRTVGYTIFFSFSALISYAYNSNTTRAGFSRGDQFYASYPAGSELLTDTTKLYKSALGNCFEEEEWGPIEWSVMAKHFERQGKSPYAYHAQYQAHLASNGNLDGSG